MTTYSGVIGKNELAETRIHSHSFYKLNLILLGFLILMAFAYVFLANFVVAQKYGFNLRKNELNALNAQTRYLNKEHESDQGMEALLLFAQKSGMVEAKEVDSILQDRDFALGSSN